ncbi:MAG: amidohydrolase family protein [Acidobacteriota bacterium]
MFPIGSCDTHMHIYDSRYPAAPTALLRPPDAPPAAYRRFQASLGHDRVVVVQPTTYGLDNRCQLDAMTELAGSGDDARAIVVVDADTSVDELRRLDELGACGARFHMLPGGAVDWDDLPIVASRVDELGWHVQLQLDGRELPRRLDTLLGLPTPLVVDHVGRFMPPVAPGHDSFRALLALLDTGRTWVKLSAPYESTLEGAPTFPSVSRLATALVAAHPERMLWASNWPHPGQPQPLTDRDLLALTLDWLPDPTVRHRVLVTNPAELYRFPPTTDPTTDPTIDQRSSP